MSSIGKNCQLLGRAVFGFCLFTDDVQPLYDYTTITPFHRISKSDGATLLLPVVRLTLILNKRLWEYSGCSVRQRDKYVVRTFTNVMLHLNWIDFSRLFMTPHNIPRNCCSHSSLNKLDVRLPRMPLTSHGSKQQSKSPEPPPLKMNYQESIGLRILKVDIDLGLLAHESLARYSSSKTLTNYQPSLRDSLTLGFGFPPPLPMFCSSITTSFWTAWTGSWNKLVFFFLLLFLFSILYYIRFDTNRELRALEAFNLKFY